MMNSMSAGGPTPYFPYEYAQPFQPLGRPMEPPPYNLRGPCSAPAALTRPINASTFQPRPRVQYICGAPHRMRSLSFSPPPNYNDDTPERHGRHGKSHSRQTGRPTRKSSRYDLQRSSQLISFPEPQRYPPTDHHPAMTCPPPPYPGSPPLYAVPEMPIGPSNPSGPLVSNAEYGMSEDEISIQPEHCTFLVDAVKEMGLCSRVFSAWVEQMDRIELGKKGSLEASIASMIVGLADDALKMLTASRSILSSYRALARLMDGRLSRIAQTSQGGNLFSPSVSPSQSQAHDDFKTLAVDVHVHSVEISACVEQMQERLHGLHDTVLRTHEKYSFRKKIWGWLCRVFRFIAQSLFLGGAVTALAHPVGVVGTAAMHIGSGLATIIASVCEKIKEAEDDEEKGLNEVLKFLQGKIPKSMRAAQTALEKFQAAHIVFRQHHRVVSGQKSGYISPREAARAQSKWHKAAKLLELKDETTLQLNLDSITW